jgi:hypothetical protein
LDKNGLGYILGDFFSKTRPVTLSKTECAVACTSNGDVIGKTATDKIKPSEPNKNEK